jgi:hypothetical protein
MPDWFVLALISTLVLESRGPGVGPFKPCGYRSSSGAYVLNVSPSDPSGTGPMHCRLVHGTDDVWSADFPWTFEEVGVAEDGTAIGYRNDDLLRIRVLDARGRTRKLVEIERAFALPRATGRVLVHSAADRAFVRVSRTDPNRDSSWLTFRISTGERLADVTAKPPLRVSKHEDLDARDARAIGDTGLTLLHWWYTDRGHGAGSWEERGGVFELADLSGNPVWTLPLLHDYTDRTSWKANEDLADSVRSRKCILEAGPGNTFALWHVLEHQRVAYSVERDASSGTGWRVVELSRSPLALENPPRFDALKLSESPRVSLLSTRQGSPSPMHDVQVIGFTDDGRVECLRRDPSANWSYVRLTSTGALDFETALDAWLPHRYMRVDAFDLQGDRWFLQLPDLETPWVELNVRTGATTPIRLPDRCSVTAIATCADGGFLALSHESETPAVKHLVRVRTNGSIAWDERTTGGGGATPFQRAFDSARDIARVGPDKFAILDANGVVTIDLTKRVLGRADLAFMLGRKLRPVGALLQDGRGGVQFVEDGRYWHFDAAGVLTEPLVPCRVNRTRDPGLDEHLRFAPNGRAWTTDGARIWRLDERGVPDVELGVAPEELAYPQFSQLDRFGRILVRDGVSQALHVFDSNGVRRFVGTFHPEDRIGCVWDSVRSTADGSIAVWLAKGIALFDEQGRRAPKDLPIGKKPGCVGWTAIDALDPASRESPAIGRRPDGKWLAEILDHAVLADGRRLILEHQEGIGAPTVLHSYTANGDPLVTLDLPHVDSESTLSVSSRWIVVGRHGPNCALVRLEDNKVFRFEPNISEPNSWHVGLTPDGRTLLLLQSKTLELRRYTLP